MSQDIIALIKNRLPIASGPLDEDTRAVAGGSNNNNNKRISIKGGVFRKFVGGKEVGAIEDRHMDVIFVKMAHSASRTYYKAAYQEGVNVSPTCWSTDGKVPDKDVKTPEASACNSCPMSVRGSSATGTTSACRLSWRTAVVLPNDPSGDVMQLVIPAQSCFGQEVDNGRRSFRPYIQFLAGHNISAGHVVTKMQFDTKSPTPKLLFAPADVVPSDMLGVIYDQGRSPAAEDAVKLTVFQRDEGKKPYQPRVAQEPQQEVAAQAPPAAAAAAPISEQQSLPLDEPKLRTDDKPVEAKGDVSDLVKRWGGKK